MKSARISATRLESRPEAEHARLPHVSMTLNSQSCVTETGGVPPDSEHRRFGRHACRIPCRLRIDETEYSGFVTDLSANGLFVHCSHRVESGTKVVVTFDAGGHDKLVLIGAVTRERRVHRGVSAVVKPGLGIGIESAPEAYFQLVMDMHGS